MTKQEFDSTKWGAGMRVRHTFTIKTTCVREFDVVSVNFGDSLIGVRDGDTEECEHCGEEVEILSWLNYENCEIIKG